MSITRVHMKAHQCDNCGEVFEGFRKTIKAIDFDDYFLDDSSMVEVKVVEELLASGSKTTTTYVCEVDCNTSEENNMWNLRWVFRCNDCDSIHYELHSAMECCDADSDDYDDEGTPIDGVLDDIRVTNEHLVKILLKEVEGPLGAAATAGKNVAEALLTVTRDTIEGFSISGSVQDEAAQVPEAVPAELRPAVVEKHGDVVIPKPRVERDDLMSSTQYKS